jgi:hypothetical protein
MSVADDADGGPVPGTVFTKRQVRILKIAVIVMGVLLVGGFAFVLAAIVYQASHPAQDAGAARPGTATGERARTIDLPTAPGANVAGLSLDGNRLAVQLDGPSGPEIAVIDLVSGKIVAHVKLKPQ